MAPRPELHAPCAAARSSRCAVTRRWTKVSMPSRRTRRIQPRHVPSLRIHPAAGPRLAARKCAPWRRGGQLRWQPRRGAVSLAAGSLRAASHQTSR